MWIDTAYAMAGSPQAGQENPFGPLVMVGIMFAIMYFMMIRPQQKKVKEHQLFIDGLARGDEIVTDGGIHGKIVGMTDTIVTLEVAEGIKMKVDRTRIAQRKGDKEAA